MDRVFDPISLEILWGRLIAAAGDAEAIVIRTAFSPILRESFDFCSMILDADGDAVVQSPRSAMSFVGTLPITLKHFLNKFPQAGLKPGDVLITNDPWIGTGHLYDISMLIPVFQRGKLVAFSGSVGHWADIGGSIWSADTYEVYEEGLFIPPIKVYEAGEPVEPIFDLIRANVRVPEQVIGDFYAQLAACEIGAKRLLELLEEEELSDFSPLSKAILQRSEERMRQAIDGIPDGEYSCVIETDGAGGEPLTIQVKITVEGSSMVVDYTGTSPQIDRGLNEPPNHSLAMTVYPIKCAIDPTTPNNSGSYRPIEVIRPVGSLVNPKYPAPVGSRQLTGHYLSAAVFGALAQAIPERVLADNGSPANRSAFSGTNDDGEEFSHPLIMTGGMGARPDSDGPSGIPFPSSCGMPSIELLENDLPVLFHEKQLMTDSGGTGRFRGGCGQQIVIEFLAERPSTVSLMMDRIDHPPQGFFGGGIGSPALAMLNGKHKMEPKGRTRVSKGDVLTLRTPGGGGYGKPSERARELVVRDVRDGIISLETARDTYGLDASLIVPNTAPAD